MPESGVTTVRPPTCATSSGPASATIAMPEISSPPLASIGIFGMLKPSLLPPTPGTQFGISIAIAFIPSIAELSSVITALIGAFTRFPIIENTLPKTSTTFCHAARQFPVKTFLMKSMIPVKIALIFVQTEESVEKSASAVPPIVLNAAVHP